VIVVAVVAAVVVVMVEAVAAVVVAAVTILLLQIRDRDGVRGVDSGLCNLIIIAVHPILITRIVERGIHAQRDI
jgi:hypothetical protein